MQLWKVYVSLATTALLAACGPGGSGYAPATNAITAVPEDVIDVRPDDYELSVLPGEGAVPQGPTASYDTGDSSGGRTLTLTGLNPVLEDAASDLQQAADAVVRANQAEVGSSTTIANEADDTEAEETVVSDVADDAVTSEEAVETGGSAAGGEDDAEMAEDLDGEVESIQTETGGEEVSEETSEETGGEETDETGGEEATEVETEEAEATPVADFDFDEELGESTYSANCVACHQPNGEGIAGAFPPLAGHIPELYNAEGGREYIINTVLYGLQGGINVQGESYNGIMNAWAQLSNEEVAATLNHELTSWGNASSLEDFSPIQPDEVEALRGQGLNGAQVMELRPELP